jgi:hypothetical protein
MRDRKPFVFAAPMLAMMIFLAGFVGESAQAIPVAPATRPAMTALSPSPAENAADEDIRDIRPPIHIPYGWLWAAYTGGGLVAVALLFGAWRLYRRHAVTEKSLYQLTLEKLEAARELMEPLKGYQFSIAVSEIIRVYIENRFSVRAAHRTTEEFLHDLMSESHEELIAHQPVLAEFLEHCDLAKFARWHLSVAQMESMYQSARAFVAETSQPAAKAVDGAPRSEVQTILSQPRLT